jgi:hypothetical protein
MTLPGHWNRPILILKNIDFATTGDIAAASRRPCALVRLQPAEADNDPVFHFDDPFAGMPLDAA